MSDDWITILQWTTAALNNWRVQKKDIPGSAHTNVRVQQKVNSRFVPDTLERKRVDEPEWQTVVKHESNHPIDTDR